MKTILNILTLFTVLNLHGQTKVLFIGNSLTYFNEMPSDLGMLLKENLDTVIIEKHTHSGTRLEFQLNNYYTSEKRYINIVELNRYKERGRDLNRYRKIYSVPDEIDLDTITKSTLQITLENNKYDYIIVQPHGSELFRPKEVFNYTTAKTFEKFYNLIDSTQNDSVKLLFFTEYPSKKFFKGEPIKISTRRILYKTENHYTLTSKDSISLLDSTQHWFPPTSVTFETPDNCVEFDVNNLKLMQKKYPFTICPTAIIFNNIKEKHPKWKMYKIANHPSKKTSFMFACVYYEMITGKSITQTIYKGKISKKNAEIIKNEVHTYLSSLK
jgi:hypothetical protein